MIAFANSNGAQVIQITLTQAIVGVVVLLIGMGIAWGTLKQSVRELKRTVNDDVKPDISNISKRVDDVLKLIAQKGLSTSNSPSVLSEEGEKVVKNSGIDTIVNDKFDLIVKGVQELAPENPYQAQQAVYKVVEQLNEDPTLKDAIEQGAFNSGYLVASVLFAGGLYIRDRVLKEIGMEPDDIDKHKPSQT